MTPCILGTLRGVAQILLEVDEDRTGYVAHSEIVGTTSGKFPADVEDERRVSSAEFRVEFVDGDQGRRATCGSGHAGTSPERRVQNRPTGHAMNGASTSDLPVSNH